MLKFSNYEADPPVSLVVFGVDEISLAVELLNGSSFLQFDVRHHLLIKDLIIYIIPVPCSLAISSQLIQLRSGRAIPACFIRITEKIALVRGGLLGIWNYQALLLSNRLIGQIVKLAN